MSLATLIAPLMGRRVCFAYKLVQRTVGRKPDKLPIDYQTGHAINHMDPSTWRTPEEIIAAGQPLAIMLHEGLGMFCLDLDEALMSDGTWSPFASGICAAFPGAGIEVSVSGRGLHVLASADLSRVPAHRTSDDAVPGLEIYTRNRFIALTGSGYVGDIRTDHTLMLQQAIATYLPGEPGSVVVNEWWTNLPQWDNGFAELSDDDLIRAMLASKPGADALFNGTASVRELWHAHVPSLIATFPTNQPGKQWDFNRADQALATHIAYFTAGDCERTLRIMWQAPLRREKWDRVDYIRRTVARACKTKVDYATREGKISSTPASIALAPVITPGVSGKVIPSVCDSANSSATVSPVPPPLGPPPAPVTAAANDQALRADRKPPGTWMTINDQRDLFAGVTYVTDIHQAMTIDGRLLTPNRFDVEYGGYEFQMSIDGAATVKSAWECFTQSRCTTYPKVQGLFFDPREEPGKRMYRDGLTYINTWQPIDIVSTPGDVTLFLQHLHNLFPNERDRTIFLSYMAFVAQYKGWKAKWTPLVQGVEGNGKTWLSEILQYCVGRRYTHWPIAKELGNHFNAQFYGKLLICVEDLMISEAQSSMWEALKPMITGDQLTVTPKGVDGVTREVCFNFILNSNFKNAIRKTRNERRISPFFCPQQHEFDLHRLGMHEGGSYFKQLFGWAESGGYANIYHYLLNHQIPDEFNPRYDCKRAPRTTATESAIRESLGIIEQEVLEAVESQLPGFRNGWISSVAFERLLERIGRKGVSRNKQRALLEDLGYQIHPDLATGRVWLPDGTRPTLYVTRAGHITVGAGLTFDQIAVAYANSQR